MKKWYMYRNEKGQEVKVITHTPEVYRELKEHGYKLINKFDLSVSDKERKAK